MPDVETIKLRAPYRAEIPDRDGVPRPTWVEDEFEVNVRAVRRSETARVATLTRRYNYADPVKTEFVDIEGGLFRHFRFLEWPDPITRELWTREPPVIGLTRVRTLDSGVRTPLLGSPFRSCLLESNSRLRMRARKHSPRPRQVAERKVAKLAKDHLRLVDGVLFQRCRPPAWSVNGRSPYRRADAVAAIMPDHDGDAGLLIDARHDPNDIASALGRSIDPTRDWIEVHEPSLLPDPTADALEAFCLRIRELPTDRRMPGANPRCRAEVDRLVADVEAAAGTGVGMDGWARRLGEIAAWRHDPEEWQKADGGLWVARLAGEFLAMQERFPSRGAAAGDDIEVSALRP